VRQYKQQATELLALVRSGDPDAIQAVRQTHPRFRDRHYADWTTSEIAPVDARLVVARAYDFMSWTDLANWVSAVTCSGLGVSRFESAVDAVISGDLETLQSKLRDDPELVRARSTRVTHFDPPVHGATLLHYVAANGVEGYRQKSPPNSV
jgi:hypothetical protein